MRAARLHRVGEPLRIEEVPTPAVRGREVLVRIAGAGVCHSDVHIRAGALPLPPTVPLPLTLGHENAGYVEAVGDEVAEVAPGDPVIVWGGRGCGSCRICRLGDEQVCNMALWLAYGGYAEFLHLASPRFLVKLHGIDPFEAAPLADAGLTPYRAIKKALPYVYPGACIAVLGAGGLGHLALQILKHVSPGVRIAAVDITDEKLELAGRLGADYLVDARGDAAAEIRRLTEGEGAQAVIDTVGSDVTLRTAAAVAGRKSIIVLVGIAGGVFPYSFLSVPGECVVTNCYWGSYTDLQELLEFAAGGRIRALSRRFALEEVNEALDLLEHGRIQGRAVIAPQSGS